VTAPYSGYPDRYHGSSYADQPPDYASYAGVPRRRRRGRVWLIVLVILIGLLIAADRVAAAVTENQLASKIQQSQHLKQRPSVSIDGFPFLTQVAARHFDHATVDIGDFDSGGVPISHIHTDLRGVHVSSGYNSATVDTLTGTATLDYTAVSQALSNNVSNIGHITLSQGTGDQVRASYGMFGVNLTADVAVKLLSGNVLEFKTVKVNPPLSGLGVSIPGATDFDAKIQLAALPFGMRLTSLQVTSTGVDISASGTDVVLTRNSVGSTG
jgi:hypothetical protein